MVMKKLKKVIAAKKKPAKAVSKNPAAKPVAKPSKKITQIDKPFTKAEIVSYLAESNGLPKTEALKVLESFTCLIESHLKKRGPGEFVLPNVAKFRVVRKEAKKARQGINPFTGESMKYAAKPAHNVVKIRPLKKLKDVIA